MGLVSGFRVWGFNTHSWDKPGGVPGNDAALWLKHKGLGLALSQLGLRQARALSLGFIGCSCFSA